MNQVPMRTSLPVFLITLLRSSIVTSQFPLNCEAKQEETGALISYFSLSLRYYVTLSLVIKVLRITYNIYKKKKV